MFSDWLSDRIIDTVVTQGRTASLPFELYCPEDHVASFHKTGYLMMLKDKARMEAYRKAIEEAVKGKVVAEIGTGAHAPLAKMCVEAGAKKVYAVEGNPKACAHVKALLERENLADKIVLIQGMSFDVALPEKCDALIHEIVGDFGSNEGMVEAVIDARKRWLKPEHRVVPDRCQSWAVPVELPSFSNPLLYKAMTMVKVLRNVFMHRRMTMEYWNFPEANYLSEPALMEDHGFNEMLSLENKAHLEFTVRKSGRFHGLLVWPRLVFSPDHALDCARGTCWGPVMLPLSKKGVNVKEGQRVIVEVEQDLRGKTKTRLRATLERNGESVALGTLEF